MKRIQIKSLFTLSAALLVGVAMSPDIAFGAEGKSEAGPAPKAGISKLTMKVKGVGCPFCVYGLEKKLKNVSGVESIEFDLKTGVADVELGGKAGFEASVKNE